MNNILIISDNSLISKVIEQELTSLCWNFQTYSIVGIMSAGSQLASNKYCIIWVIDERFNYHFGNMSGEMEAIVRNCSEKTSIYFLINDSSEHGILSWKKYAKKLFGVPLNPQNVKNILNEIVSTLI